MPKNKGKGGKNRRRGKNENETEKRELVFKEDGQEYAQVTKMLGNGRLEAMCFDGTNLIYVHPLLALSVLIVSCVSTSMMWLYDVVYCSLGTKRLCHIRGKLRKKVWINTGDIILVGLRDYQDAKADVILKYTPDEARNLKSYGEFPESVKISDQVTFVDQDMDDDIEFGDELSEDEESEDDIDNI